MLKDREGERSGGVWNTQDEINFIHAIGSGINVERAPTLSRAQVLNNYERILMNRDIWIGLKKEIIMKYIAEEIDNERKKCS